MDSERIANRRRRRRRRKLQRLIPAAIAIVLIAVIATVGWKTGLFESFLYTSEEADLFSYFGAIGDDYAVIVEDGEITTRQMKVIDGVMYQDLDSVKEEYNDRFYLDVNDNALLYTTAVEVISAPIGGNSYTSQGKSEQLPYVICIPEKDTYLVALDYVRKYADFTYDLYGGTGEPYRASIRTGAKTIPVATVTKEQAVRISPDKKAKILKQMQEGDKLTVLEEDTEWTKVQTQDLIIGYYETRFLVETENETVQAP